MAAPMPRKKDDSDQFVKESKQAIDPVVLTRALGDAMERALPMIQDFMERRGPDLTTSALDPLLDVG